jgi:protein SCO1/2
LLLAGGLLQASLVAFLFMTAAAQTTDNNASQQSSSIHATGHAQANPLQQSRLFATSDVTPITIPDITLTDQDNRKVSLYTDLMKDKLVVLNFFYTTCTGICPTTGLWLSNLQNKLGPRLGKDVILISISLDPDVDTPDKIKAWSMRWKRKPGWSLLTSPTKEVQELTKQFLVLESAGMHSPTVFIGDGTRNDIGWVSVDILDQSRALMSFFENATGK